MFNRKLEVKMVKSNKNESTEPILIDARFEKRAATIGYYFEKCIRKAGNAALAYVVLDTVRQVMVTKANQQ